MQPDHPRIPEGPGDDPREYGRHLAIDGLLTTALAGEPSASLQRNKRRRYWIVGAAAGLLVGIVSFFFLAKPSDAAVVARVERMQGTVHVLADGKKVAAVLAQELLSGQGLEVRGQATLRCVDGTRIEVGPDTTLTELAQRGGLSVVVARGAVAADVKPQPAGRPMVFRFPQGEATVLGTSLKLLVDPDPARGATRLDVIEGKVRLLRWSDQRSVDVPSGHFAVAAAGLEMAVKPLTPAAIQHGGAFGKVEDSVLYGFAEYENRNFGARPRLRISFGNTGYTTILRFPELVGAGPDQMQAGSAVESAMLRLHVYRPPGNTLRFRFARCLKPWNAGRGNSSPALPGEVTWNAAHHGALPWEVPGAKGPTDRAPELVSPWVRVESGGFATFDLTPIVQAWAKGEPNYGVFIDPVGNAVDEAGSAEDPVEENRPLLTVTLRK